jgi:hypothetical protein
MCIEDTDRALLDGVGGRGIDRDASSPQHLRPVPVPSRRAASAGPSHPARRCTPRACPACARRSTSATLLRSSICAIVDMTNVVAVLLPVMAR